MLKNLYLDLGIFICIVLLASLGLSVLASVSPNLFPVQLIFVFIGLIAFALFSNMDYHLLSPFSRYTYTFSLLALSFTLLIGFASRGATRWIELGLIRIQFSELLKPFLIVAAANFLGKIQGLAKLFLSILLTVPIMILILKQPDLGTALVYFLTLLSMLVFSGIGLKLLILEVALAFLSVPLLWGLLADYQRQRIVTFFSPEHDFLGASYNAIQSVITVGSGSLLGRGLGRGTQTHLLFLPEKHTDFIFASFAEEFGFVGSMFLLLVYFVLFVRIIYIFRQTDDPLAKIIVIGVLAIIFFPMFINISMNIGILPITGVPLPLVSYGGSSFLGTSIALGLIARIQKENREKRLL